MATQGYQEGCPGYQEGYPGLPRGLPMHKICEDLYRTCDRTCARTCAGEALHVQFQGPAQDLPRLVHDLCTTCIRLVTRLVYRIK